MKTLMMLVLFSSFAFAQNMQYPRVMACQTPDSRLYIEVFHDQSGMMGAPKNPIGYLIVWATTMGKDTQKRLVLDVPMKHVGVGSDCAFDAQWSQQITSGEQFTRNFQMTVKSCNMMNFSPEGVLLQRDFYKSGKVVAASALLKCQLQ